MTKKSGKKMYYSLHKILSSTIDFTILNWFISKLWAKLSASVVIWDCWVLLANKHKKNMTSKQCSVHILNVSPCEGKKTGSLLWVKYEPMWTSCNWKCFTPKHFSFGSFHQSKLQQNGRLLVVSLIFSPDP